MVALTARAQPLVAFWEYIKIISIHISERRSQLRGYGHSTAIPLFNSSRFKVMSLTAPNFMTQKLLAVAYSGPEPLKRCRFGRIFTL